MWRQKSATPDSDQSPVLYVRNPDEPLPVPPAYQNLSFYMFRPRPSASSPPRSAKSSAKSSKQTRKHQEEHHAKADPPKYKREFEQFHNENGVRTIMGGIGPVKRGTHLGGLIMLVLTGLSVRMLLKAGYRHVYISRQFAVKHGFIPADAAPGHYGYGGLVKYVRSQPRSSLCSRSSPAAALESGQSPLAARRRRIVSICPRSRTSTWCSVVPLSKRAK